MIHPDKLETGDWVRYKIGLEHGKNTVYDFGVIADAHHLPYFVKLESGVIVRIENITDVRRRPITDADITIACGVYTEKTAQGMDIESAAIVRDVLTKFAKWFVKVIQHE